MIIVKICIIYLFLNACLVRIRVFIKGLISNIKILRIRDIAIPKRKKYLDR
jgi:hypothetical protein